LTPALWFCSHPVAGGFCGRVGGIGRPSVDVVLAEVMLGETEISPEAEVGFAPRHAVV
jgi:hypothetical protein